MKGANTKVDKLTILLINIKSHTDLLKWSEGQGWSQIKEPRDNLIFLFPLVLSRQSGLLCYRLRVLLHGSALFSLVFIPKQ